jgi:hypothetical protein
MLKPHETAVVSMSSPERLRHVLWIGGSPCSGKSTIAHTIARIYVFLGYYLDPMEPNHFARRIAAGDAEAEAFLAKTMDERWLKPSVDELAQTAIASWTRRFGLVLDDLLAMTKESFIVSEGIFFPACVAPYLSSPHQAIWLVPTDDFCAEARRRRGEALAARQKRHGVYNEGSDPEARLRKVIARDQQLARYVRHQAEELGLTIIEVDGSRSTDEMTELVEQHFDPYLLAAFKRVQEQ